MRCPAELREQKQALTRQALALAPEVLKNPKTPRRDRLALRALRLGSVWFDLLWRLGERRRG